MTTDEKRLQVLKRVEDGVLSIEEGADLLSLIDRADENEKSNEVEHGKGTAEFLVEKMAGKVPAGWKALWSAFIWIGVILMGVSGFWLISSYNRSGMGWGFWFALLFLALSVMVVYFGWRLVSGRWMMARVRSVEDGEEKRIKFWAPVPIHMGIWAFKTFGKYMPDDVQEKDYCKILEDLDQSIGEGEVFAVEFDGDGHQNVQFKLQMD